MNRGAKLSIFNKIKNKYGKSTCRHDNIKWLDEKCMIAGYKQEGICLDCDHILLKNIYGEVEEK